MVFCGWYIWTFGLHRTATTAKVGPTLPHGKLWCLAWKPPSPITSIKYFSRQCVIDYAGSGNCICGCGTRADVAALAFFPVKRFDSFFSVNHHLPCNSVLLVFLCYCSWRKVAANARANPSRPAALPQEQRWAGDNIYFNLDHLPSPALGRALPGTVVTGLLTSSTGCFSYHGASRLIFWSATRAELVKPNSELQ